MKYELAYSPDALDDLDRKWSEVWDASKDMDITDDYVEGIRNAIREKKKAPKTGMPLNFEGEFTGIYFVVFKKYIAFYRLHGNIMEVGRILYSKSDYMRVLFGEGA